jgi:hypothetical protein
VASGDADSSKEGLERDDSEQPRRGHPLSRSWCHQLSPPSPVSDDALQALGESSHALDLTLRRQRRVGRHHWGMPVRRRRPRLLVALLARALTGRSHERSIAPSRRCGAGRRLQVVRTPSGATACGRLVREVGSGPTDPGDTGRSARVLLHLSSLTVKMVEYRVAHGAEGLADEYVEGA